MQKQLFFLIFILFVIGNTHAQRNFWSSVEGKSIKINQKDVIKYDIVLKKANYFQLDKASLFSQLNMAPYRDNDKTSNVKLVIPDQNGDFEVYEMFKVKTLSDQLAQKYPEIQSFVGRRSDKRDASLLRVTITPQGFYAMVKKPDVGQLFINPYDKNGDYYISYLKSRAQSLSSLKCEVTYPEGLAGDITKKNISDSDYENFIVDDSTLRAYDLALACTGEYAQFHVNQAGLGAGTNAQQIAAVLAAMVVTIDRVNSIYEIDLGVTLQLVANNDQLIYLNPNSDPYTNSNVFTLTTENQSVIDTTIGSSNYDIGHVFGTTGGGYAPGSVCVNGLKAQAATGTGNPVGDPFDVDFAAHEFGHQFGADHTQNNNCARFLPTAVEPGSASTIMGYAGICAPNIQNNSDAYFHQISINQIYNNISSGSGSACGNFVNLSNTAPTFTPLPNHTIPNGTAFYLDINAVDAENDPLTYNWEQINTGISPSHPPEPSFTLGPNFRSLPSSSESRRYFPKFNEVITNNLTPTWEVVPSVARSMNFAVTIRDNNLLVGQSSRDITTVNFANVGPFQVTSQNTTNINWLPGETRTVTWDVAGTTGNGINTSNVNILLSTDGGLTFNTTLASNVANDGSEDITVPSLQAPFCRIMVEPVDNVYYALNSTTFAIDSNCQSYINNSSLAISDGSGNNLPGPEVQSTINIADNISSIDDIFIKLIVTHSYIQDLDIRLENPNGDSIILWGRNCLGEDGINISFNDSGAVLPFQSSCDDPIIGIYSPADTATDLATLFSSGTQGDWTLRLRDFFNQDQGTLDSWEIEICSSTFSVEDNQINNFSIYPNPNNGSFNLSFAQAIGSNSEISLYDIQGRLIEKLDFDPNALNQRIQLKNQYQSGVYLVEVGNSKEKFVKKLIIR